MNRIETIQFSTAITNKDLKAKHLSGNHLVSYCFLKDELQAYFDNMGKAEKELAKIHKIEQDEFGNFLTKDKDFIEKLQQIQDQEFESKHLNFIDDETVEKLVKETDLNTAYIVFKHLKIKESV